MQNHTPSLSQLRSHTSVRGIRVGTLRSSGMQSQMPSPSQLRCHASLRGFRVDTLLSSDTQLPTRGTRASTKTSTIPRVAVGHRFGLEATGEMREEAGGDTKFVITLSLRYVAHEANASSCERPYAMTGGIGHEGHCIYP